MDLLDLFNTLKKKTWTWEKWLYLGASYFSVLSLSIVVGVG